MAVEEAAKGGGVYPEVLFEVAHQWFWLYEQTAGGSSTAREGATSCSASGIRAAGEAGRGLPEGRGGPGTEPVTVAAAAVTAATVVPVISVGSSLYPGPGLGHGHSPGLHPYTALQPHLPCSPQYLTHPAHPAHPMPHMPRPAVFPVASSAYPQVRPVFCWEAGHVGELPGGSQGLEEGTLGGWWGCPRVLVRGRESGDQPDYAKKRRDAQVWMNGRELHPNTICFSPVSSPHF